MLLSRKSQLVTLIVWIFIVPPGFYFALNYLPAKEINWVNIVLFFVIILVTMTMSIRLPNLSISLERWITLTIFFQYGLFAELVFTQIALIIALFSEKSSIPISHRFFVNSTMFTIVSIVSGLVFHLAGGQIGMLKFTAILVFGFLYAATYTVLNSILMKIYFTLRSLPFSIWSKGTLWDNITTMILLPLSMSLYYLDAYFGSKSILLIGVPFLFVLWIIRLYHYSDNLNDKLSSASVIGRELSDRLGFEDVIRTFIVKLQDVVPYDHAYVLDFQSGEHLVMLMGSEKGVVSKNINGLVFKQKKVSDDGLNQNVTKIFGTKKEVKLLKNFEFLYPVESIMTAPIIRNQKTEGFLILTSSRKNVFQALEMKIVDVLTGYFSISLIKARLYENTVEQSERCGLTQLHNFRYLDAKMDEEIIRYHTGEIDSLSTIIIDIDHFKSINDTYGHQSGNDLLCALATILTTYVGPDVTLARYGGEEFVFVLPNIGKVETVKIAEEVRKEVAASLFRIIPDLSEDRSPIHVNMTISIGVATVPDDAGDAKLLLRNADRALYIGGKQAGRNRVGVFSEQEIVTV